jgi:hypothetical protein
MKKIIFMVLSTIFLIADNMPQKVESSISSIEKDGQITLSKSVPKGRSGIIIHSYGNGLFAITHRAISLGGDRAEIKKYQALKHENLPTVKTAPQKGDRVVFGSLYNNILLLAPDEQSYSTITKSMKKVWIHPDIYAYFLIKNDETKITLENLKKFAVENQVGLIAIVAKDGIRILDPISSTYLRKLPLNIDISKAQSPFYARFEQIETDIFSMADEKEFPAYYSGIEAIR